MYLLNIRILPGRELEGGLVLDNGLPVPPRFSRDELPAGLCVCSGLRTNGKPVFLWVPLLEAGICQELLLAGFCTDRRLFFESGSSRPAFSTALFRSRRLR